MSRRARVDTSKFEALGKVPWSKRLELINQEFPSTVQMDWVRAFSDDVDLYGRILRDIFKVDQAKPGRSGPRPVLDRDLAMERLKQFKREDYSEFEFRDAFAVLAAGMSHRGLEAKTGLNRNMIQKLLAGKREPDIPLMEQIAKAFKKNPAYFLEYRTAYILGALAQKMDASPEMSIDLYNRLNPRK